MKNDIENILYKNLDENTKKYVNKAIEIYKVLKDKDILIAKWALYPSYKYKFTNFDKMLISLFISGFIAEGNLKEMISDTGEIDINKVLNIINLNLEEVKQLEEDEYERIYDSNFYNELLNLEIDELLEFSINKISPEVIFSWLTNRFFYKQDYKNIIHTMFEILNVKDKEYLSDKLCFKKPKEWAINNGYMRKKEITYDTLDSLFNSYYNNENKNIIVDHDQIKKNEAKEEMTQTFDDDKTWGVLDKVTRKFVGQETAVQDLFYNIVNNQQIALSDESFDGERSIIFLDGPTGTGKTAITREITEKLDIPFVATSITNYSQPGYVGDDLTDILKQLYEKSGENLEKAQRGIVVLDEFDKITYKSGDGLEMKKAVQQQLLDFMGGGKYKISNRMGLFFSSETEFDTSKLTFVCLGALTDLRDDKTNGGNNPLGFENEGTKNNSDTYSITPQDLIDLGLERELVGRFNTYIHTEEYSKEDLLKILKESEISPIIGFKRWIQSKNKKIVIEDEVYEAIVDAAYELNTGARSLQTVVNNIRTYFLKDVLRGTDDTIYLDTDTVINICNKIVNRRRKR